ncbi:hypothetical protein GWI33_009160, partial [Rhynchophorus ferrugineus]
MITEDGERSGRPKE